MKRLVLVAFLCLTFKGLAHADHFEPDLMYETAVSSFTQNIITVSTSAATQMDNATLKGRVVIRIQNIDTAANLWCGPTSGVTSGNGDKVVPGASLVINVKDVLWGTSDTAHPAFHYYCISDGASSTKGSVDQSY